MDYKQQVEQAMAYIQGIHSDSVAIGIILGTGLGNLASQIEVDLEIPYQEIPHFPVSTVESHSGTLLFGRLGGKKVLAMKGRFHYYEGYSLRQVTFPVRVMRALGAQTLVLTSAVGGMNPHFQLADLVILEDHINLMPDNPLRGINDDRLGPRFPDMSQPYSQRLIEVARQTALKMGIAAHKAVLAAVPGPNLETRAEYRMLKLLGADVVGMSTVPECIAATHAGMQVLAFSVVTDMCLPDALEPADIAKIVAVAGEGGQKLEQLLLQLFQEHGTLFQTQSATH